MSDTMVGLFSILMLFSLMLLSVPVFVSMGIAATAGFLLLDQPIHVLWNFAEVTWQSSSLFELVAIPLFVFTGILMGRIDAGRDLFNVTKAWVGRVPNSLGVASIVACGIFAAITGSSIATAATVGIVAIPLLLQEKYSQSQAGGFVAGGGTLGIIFPPSIPLILYGVMTENSAGKLFMSSLFPGIIMMSLFAIYVMFSRPRIMQAETISWPERWAITRKGIGGLLLPVIIVGAIYTGLFTPTEVAGLAVLYVIVLGLLLRRLNLKVFLDAAGAATKTTAMLFMLIVFGQYFAHFLTYLEVPQHIAHWITTVTGGSLITVTLMIIVYIILGVFLESAAMLLISVPIFYPIAHVVGMHPLSFGVFCCVAMEIAQIHPPIGINLFTIHGISKIPLWELAKGTLPFLLLQIGMLYAIYFFPQLTLWIPLHMMGAK